MWSRTARREGQAGMAGSLDLTRLIVWQINFCLVLTLNNQQLTGIKFFFASVNFWKTVFKEEYYVFRKETTEFIC